MDSQLLYTDNFHQMTFHRDSRVQVMKWLPGSAAMNAMHFRGALFTNAAFALQTRPRGILIDTTDFAAVDAPGPDMMDWRAAHIAPLYNESGTRRFAFYIGPEGEVPPVDGQKMPNEAFPTRWFTSRDEALTWLAS